MGRRLKEVDEAVLDLIFAYCDNYIPYKVQTLTTVHLPDTFSVPEMRDIVMNHIQIVTSWRPPPPPPAQKYTTMPLNPVLNTAAFKGMPKDAIPRERDEDDEEDDDDEEEKAE